MNKLMENWRKFINEGKFTPYYIKFNPEGGVTEEDIRPILTDLREAQEQLAHLNTLVSTLERRLSKVVRDV